MRLHVNILLILGILVLVAPQSVYAFAQFEDSASSIVLEIHLIEMGYVASGDVTSVVSRETLVFKSYGGNYSGPLNVLVPEGSANIMVSRSNHQTGDKTPRNHTQNGNTITWEADIVQDSPAMYSVDYTTDLEPGSDGVLNLKRIINHKTLSYPTAIFTLVISGSDNIVFEDMNGNTIMPDESGMETDRRVSSWGFKGELLELNEINIVRKEDTGIDSTDSADNTDNTELYMFGILGIVALIVILYPFISSKFKGSGKKGTSK